MNFKTLTLLAIVAFIAAWLATFSAGDLSADFGQDLRRALWSVVLVVPVVAVFYFRGRRQAFFLGVLVVLVVQALELSETWLPVIRGRYSISDRMTDAVFSWVDFSGYSEERSLSLDRGFRSTFELLFTVFVCSIAGLVALAIHDRSQSRDSAES